MKIDPKYQAFLNKIAATFRESDLVSILEAGRLGLQNEQILQEMDLDTDKANEELVQPLTQLLNHES